MNDIRTSQEEPKKAPSAFSDAATEVDELGRDRYVKALTELIKTSDTPMVLAVYGNWGLGKTSLMMQLRRMLDPEHDVDQSKRTIEASARTVWFDPWMHQFDKTPVLGLLHATTDQLNLATKIGVKEALVKIATALVEEAKIPYVGIKLGRLFKIRKEIEESDFFRREQQARLHKHFEEVINAAVENKKRVVFFIDDLDRCQPDQALAMLEALKLYLDFPHCIYVLGVDRGPLEASVRQQYKLLELNAESYLDKIVQLPFVIPSIDDNLMKKFIEKRIPGKLLSCLDVLATAGADDPRQVKRILNSLSFNDHLVVEEAFHPPYDPLILAVIILLQNLAPELYRDLRLHPSLIHDLFQYIVQRKEQLTKLDDNETSVVEEDDEVVRSVDAAKAASPYRDLWEDYFTSKPRLIKALQLITIDPDLDPIPYLTLTSTVQVETEPKEPEQLRKTQLTINQMQNEFFNLFEKGEIDEALNVSQKSLDTLKKATRRFPQDPYLRVNEGFIYKNNAVAQQRLGKQDEAEKNLAKAENVFNSMKDESPLDAAAWNGLGSVAVARGDYETALECIDLALDINPEYEAAHQDREMVMKYLKREKKG